MEFLSLLASISGNDIENNIKSLSIRTVLLATLILVVLLLVSSKIVKNNKYKKLKKPLFILISATVIIPTLLMSGSTVYLNTISDSKGPVHWHADVEFWVCGQEIELRDPFEFLSNKIGSSTYHEHNDKRIHLEGVVIDAAYDSSLEKFLDVTGGKITDSKLVIPTTETIFENDFDGDKNTGDLEHIRSLMSRDSEQRATIAVQNGISGCGGAGYAEVQAFVYTYNKDNDTYSQRKLDSPKSYVMRDEPIVPPGDCLIVEYGTVKDKTDKLCQQYGVQDVERCTEFGVENFSPKLCKIREVNQTGSPL